MKDPFGRTVDYLRVSVTDRCNFRCVYCMPEDGAPFLPRAEILSADEIVRVVRVALGLGVSKVRLTGGEPLVRADLVEIVQRIAAIPGLRDLSLTTNGQRLASLAQPLAKAGLHRVNVSLDTLKPERFRAIARGGDFEAVINGIAAAGTAGLGPTKINVVAMKGVNDDEAVDFAAWTMREDVHVRFIELMPIRWNLDETAPMPAWSAHAGPGLLTLTQASGGMLSDLEMRRMAVTSAELQQKIEQSFGELEVADIPTNGPARSYRLKNGIGSVGFISQISNDLCSRCNRIRLTADGFLRPCLMSDGELDVRGPMRGGADDEAVADLIRHVVLHKPERHYLAEGQKVTGRGMSQIGG